MITKKHSTGKHNAENNNNNKMSNKNKDPPSKRSLITKPNENNGAKKLSLEEKRNIAYEWFTDPKTRSIQEFCTNVKHTPEARAFVRKARDQLHLVPLRFKRVEDSCIDSIVLEQLSNFIPSKRKEGVKKRCCCLDKESMKQILVDFYQEDQDVPLQRFMKEHDACCLIPLARTLKLRSRKKRRDEDERVLADIEAKVDNLNYDDDDDGEVVVLVPNPNVTPAASLLKKKNKKEKKKELLSMQDPHKAKTLLLEWFDDVTSPSLSSFLQTRNAKKLYLKPLREIAKEATLFRLRKFRDEQNIRQEVLEKLTTLFESYLNDVLEEDQQQEGGAADSNKNKTNLIDKKKRPRSQQNKTTPHTNNTTCINATLLKSLLQEWFQHPNHKIPPSKFLRQKNLLEYKYPMIHLIRQLHLIQLRRRCFSGKEEEEEEERNTILGVAMKRIEQIDSLETKSCEKSNDGTVTTTAPTTLSNPILNNNNSNKKRNKITKKNNTTTTDNNNTLKICNILLKNPTTDQDTIRTYLKEWCFNPTRTSLAEFLKEKERMDLVPVMKRLVRKLELRKLRREHIRVCKKVEGKIDCMFEKKKKKKMMEKGGDKGIVKEDAVKGEKKDGGFVVVVSPSAPPLEEGEVDVVLEDDLRNVVVVDADISKIGVDEGGVASAPMDMDDYDDDDDSDDDDEEEEDDDEEEEEEEDDASEYISVSASTVVAKN